MSTSIKLIYFTDPHIQDGCPPSRKGDYREQIFAKMVDIGRMANEHKCDFAVCGGDVFEYQLPEKNKYSVVNRLIDVFRGYGIPLYGVEGNHDLRNDRQDSIASQPIGALIRSGVYKHLRREVIKVGDLSLGMFGFDFEENPDYDSLVCDTEGLDFTLAVLHMYASRKGGDMFGTKVHAYEDLARLPYNDFFFGHYHCDQGVEMIGEKKFINVGSVSRGSYGDDNVNRIPRVVIYTVTKHDDGTVTSTAEPIEISVAKPGDEVFDVVRQESIEKNRKETAAFAEELKRVRTSVSEDQEEESELSSDIQVMLEEGVQESTLALVNDLIVRATAELQAANKTARKNAN